MRGVFASGDDIGVDVSVFVAFKRIDAPDAMFAQHRIRAAIISRHESRHGRAVPERAYNLAITAEANSEVFTSCAPSIWRAKS